MKSFEDYTIQDLCRMGYVVALHKDPHHPSNSGMHASENLVSALKAKIDTADKTFWTNHFTMPPKKRGWFGRGAK